MVLIRNSRPRAFGVYSGGIEQGASADLDRFYCMNIVFAGDVGPSTRQSNAITRQQFVRVITQINGNSLVVDMDYRFQSNGIDHPTLQVTIGAGLTGKFTVEDFAGIDTLEAQNISHRLVRLAGAGTYFIESIDSLCIIKEPL